MTKKEKPDVLSKLDWEGGFDYFVGGNDFKYATKDKNFHRLREAFVKAHNALQEYLGELEY